MIVKMAVSIENVNYFNNISRGIEVLKGGER